MKAFARFVVKCLAKTEAIKKFARTERRESDKNTVYG